MNQEMISAIVEEVIKQLLSSGQVVLPNSPNRSCKDIASPESKATPLLEHPDDPEALERLCENLHLDKKFSRIPNGIRFVGDVDLNGIFSDVIAEGIRITSVNCLESSFEDYYLQTIGGERA